MTLVITDEDIELFDKLARARDIQDYYHHCQDSFPLWSELMGEENVNQVIEQALLKGKKNHFTLVDTIRLYLDTLIILGEHFQSDMQYKSFNAILMQTEHSEMSRASQLYELLIDYTEKVMGNDGTQFKEMLFLISTGQLPIGEDEDFSARILLFFKQINPQKVSFVGESVYQELIAWGQEQALVKYGFQTSKQQTFYVLLIFVLGQYFDTDLTCQWLNWNDIARQIKVDTYTLKDLAKTLARIIITKRSETDGE